MEGRLGEGLGGGVRLWGSVEGGVSGCGELQVVLSFILLLYSTEFELQLALNCSKWCITEKSVLDHLLPRPQATPPAKQ